MTIVGEIGRFLLAALGFSLNLLLYFVCASNGLTTLEFALYIELPIVGLLFIGLVIIGFKKRQHRDEEDTTILLTTAWDENESEET